MNFNYPLADATTLMGQAMMTAHDYMLNAKRDIDKIFGADFATNHPELVCAYMRTAAEDCNAAITAKAIGAGLSEIANAISMHTNAIEDLTRETAAGLSDIAAAIAP
jgi:hypothetical protein